MEGLYEDGRVGRLGRTVGSGIRCLETDREVIVIPVISKQVSKTDLSPVASPGAILLN